MKKVILYLMLTELQNYAKLSELLKEISACSNVLGNARGKY